MLIPIEEALRRYRDGEMLILVDDENRENEGDLVIAAEHITPEAINFMVTHGRGMVCMPITMDRACKLGLDPMCPDNMALHSTHFSVTVDAKEGIGTGISVSDRARTVQRMIEEDTQPEDLARPGHIFPLIAWDGGVLCRPGHTEATVDLARLAGLKPAAVLCEILNEDGTMARMPDLRAFAEKHGMVIVSIEDLINYRKQTEEPIDCDQLVSSSAAVDQPEQTSAPKSGKRYERIRGMYDILPEEIRWWRMAENAMLETARCYNYREIRFPVVEYTELFARGMGEATDVVGKEMYTFPDRKGRSLTLRPEGTASVVRAYLNEGWQTTAPFQKLFYIGPMFRYEKPQKGRCRQFHQFGIELLGSMDPSADVEVVSFAWAMMDKLGIGGLWLRLNSIGCSEDRERFRLVLKEHFAPHIEQMCSDCKRRLEENPLRILDCKEAQCQPFIESAPGSAEHLCEECATHFAAVTGSLDALGLEYQIDSRLVRGIDYYTRTVFELMSKDLGSQDTLLGGGRYDGLVETFGGPSIPGLGFAGGFERLVIILQERAQAEAEAQQQTGGIDLFLASLGDEGRAFAISLAEALRRLGLSVDFDHRGRALRKQMTLANQQQARYLLVIGGDEAESKSGKIKHMDSGEETLLELRPESILSFITEGA